MKTYFITAKAVIECIAAYSFFFTLDCALDLAGGRDMQTSNFYIATSGLIGFYGTRVFLGWVWKRKNPFIYDIHRRNDGV